MRRGAESSATQWALADKATSTSSLTTPPALSNSKSSSLQRANPSHQRRKTASTSFSHLRLRSSALSLPPSLRLCTLFLSASRLTTRLWVELSLRVQLLSPHSRRTEAKSAKRCSLDQTSSSVAKRRQKNKSRSAKRKKLKNERSSCSRGPKKRLEGSKKKSGTENLSESRRKWLRSSVPKPSSSPLRSPRRAVAKSTSR